MAVPSNLPPGARELRRLLDEGRLSALAEVDFGDGVTLPLELAARIVLADLDDLANWDADEGPISVARLTQFRRDLHRLLPDAAVDGAARRL
jgi:hypothetical protein